MSKCPQVEIMELEEQVAELLAEVKLQSDSADHWEDEAMNHMSQAAQLQADNDRLRHILYTEGWSDAVIDRVIKEMK
jgi:hypothetical protein